MWIPDICHYKRKITLPAFNNRTHPSLTLWRTTVSYLFHEFPHRKNSEQDGRFSCEGVNTRFCPKGKGTQKRPISHPPNANFLRFSPKKPKYRPRDSLFFHNFKNPLKCYEYSRSKKKTSILQLLFFSLTAKRISPPIVLFFSRTCRCQFFPAAVRKTGPRTNAPHSAKCTSCSHGAGPPQRHSLGFCQRAGPVFNICTSTQPGFLRKEFPLENI